MNTEIQELRDKAALAVLPYYVSRGIGNALAAKRAWETAGEFIIARKENSIFDILLREKPGTRGQAVELLRTILELSGFAGRSFVGAVEKYRAAENPLLAYANDTYGPVKNEAQTAILKWSRERGKAGGAPD